MSVEFSNAYQEILLDNLVSVIKQNFLFQTQLKIAESSVKNTTDLKKQLDELTANYNNAKTELSQLNTYKAKAEANTTAHEEKSRIQTALNDTMKKCSILQKEIEQKNNEIKLKEEDLKNILLYVQKLEEIVPATKLKKLKQEQNNVKDLTVFEEKNETAKVENKIQKVLDGSAF